MRLYTMLCAISNAQIYIRYYIHISMYVEQLSKTYFQQQLEQKCKFKKGNKNEF